MKIHEYQGKELLGRYGIKVPEGSACFTAEQAEAAARSIVAKTGISTVVVKAQIHAGGRGKGGGVRVVRGGPAEVRRVAPRS